MCIKAGDLHTGLITSDGPVGDCYAVEGIGTATVTVTRTGEGPECSGISHIDVRTEPAPEDDETVTVIKDLVDDTSGTFDLEINGTVHATGGDSTTTGPIVTAEGSVTVSESAAGTTDLADYTSSITCVAGETVIVDAQPGTSATFTLGDNQDVVCTITNTLIVEEDGEGILEIDKFYCPSDEDGTEFIVSDPAEAESLRTLQDEEPAGCSTGDATFTITNTDTGQMWENVSVGEDGQIETPLPDGNYTITETSTDEDPAPSASFTIVDGMITAVIVINLEGEEDEEGQVKIIKLFCDAEEDGVTFTIEGGDQLPPSLENCELGDAAFRLNDGATFPIGSDGIWFASVPVGSYTLSEVLPHQATSQSFDVELGEITTIIVVNNEGGEGGEEEMVEVSIMKHLCTDVANVDDFEAIEAAAAEENPDNAFAPLVATVLACPTIVFTGDVPTEGAISAGDVDYEFSVIDANGTQLLSEDGNFMQAALCESDVALDLDGDPEVDACLDVSHYTFEVVDGLVVITETDAPAGHHFGTIRFTPGSDDADTLVGTIANVEATGVIVLDTTADADDAVMIHAYNFVNEGTQGGNPGGEGTLGGNPTLPNTAMELGSTGTVPSALLALLMLSGLGAAGYAARAEARRRR